MQVHRTLGAVCTYVEDYEQAERELKVALSQTKKFGNGSKARKHLAMCHSMLVDVCTGLEVCKTSYGVNNWTESGQK